ncbi:unnamed protein product, partial [Amoebophrya sp. A120]
QLEQHLLQRGREQQAGVEEQQQLLPIPQLRRDDVCSHSNVVDQQSHARQHASTNTTSGGAPPPQQQQQQQPFQQQASPEEASLATNSARSAISYVINALEGVMGREEVAALLSNEVRKLVTPGDEHIVATRLMQQQQGGLGVGSQLHGGLGQLHQVGNNDGPRGQLLQHNTNQLPQQQLHGSLVQHPSTSPTRAPAFGSSDRDREDSLMEHYGPRAGAGPPLHQHLQGSPRSSMMFHQQASQHPRGQHLQHPVDHGREDDHDRVARDDLRRQLRDLEHQYHEQRARNNRQQDLSQ